MSALTVYALLRAFASLFALFVALGHDVPLVVLSYSVTMPLYDSAWYALPILVNKFPLQMRQHLYMQGASSCCKH